MSDKDIRKNSQVEKYPKCPQCGDANPMFTSDGDYRLSCHNGGTEWDPETGRILRDGCCDVKGADKKLLTT